MEFGKLIDLSELDHLNWELPSDDPLTAPFLEKQLSTPPRLWMGAPAWAHKEWIEKIYPAKTKAEDFLFHYSRYFNTIELNTSHYRIPTLEQTTKWRAKVPENFRFCAKIFQGISHDLQGLNDVALINSWCDFLQNLGSHAGPSFLQLPPYFGYQHKAILFRFLQLWPAEFQLSLEFRHPSWFQGPRLIPALTQYLQSRNIGLVITDVAGRRDVLHSSISAGFTQIRFIGNNVHPTDLIRAQNWNDRLSNWTQLGLQDVYFFVHQPDDILVPEMTEHLKQLSFFQTTKLG